LPWVEASLGCEVVADFTTGSTRSLPPEEFRGPDQVPRFSADNPWVRKMLEFIPALVEASKGRYPVGVTLMRGISDLLAALYGGEDFIYGMLEQPEEVRSTVERLTDYWIDFGRCLLDHLPQFHGGTGAFFYALWCPGITIWMQEDAAALLSPQMYEQFIDAANRRIADAFEHSVIHLHLSRFIPVDYLVATGIDVNKLHIDKGGPTAEDLFAVHTKIIAGKPLFIYGNVSREDFDYIFKNLPQRGLAVNMVVDSVQEAHRIWEHFEEIVSKQTERSTQ